MVLLTCHKISKFKNYFCPILTLNLIINGAYNQNNGHENNSPFTSPLLSLLHKTILVLTFDLPF